MKIYVPCCRFCRTIANVEMNEKNSFQTHIIYKDSDTFEVIRAASEILGMQFKSNLMVNLLMRFLVLQCLSCIIMVLATCYVRYAT